MRWWRRNDGFEWKEYVRTTVLVRRQQRRDKLEAAKVAAVEGVKEAGRKGLAAGAAGAEVAGQAAVKLAKTAAEGAGAGAEKGLALAVRAAAGARSRIAAASEPVNARLSAPNVARTLAVIAVLASVGAAVRFWQFGLDRDALIMATTGGVAALLWLWPRLFSAAAEAEDEWAVRTERVVAAVDKAGSLLPVAGAAGFALLIFWLAAPAVRGWLSESSRETTSAEDARPNGSDAVEGVARVAGPGLLRVAGTLIRLDGITPLDAAQTCRRADQTSWSCGAAAKQALEKLVRGRKPATCTLTGEIDGGRIGTCRIEDRDIAAELVRGGHAFAEGTLWATYAGEQDEAQAKQVGLWGGDGERPDAWRERMFTQAAERAPGNCPIKGRIQSGKRTYVLPHSADYGRTSIREGRGEKWFCTIEEAEAAGFSGAD